MYIPTAGMGVVKSMHLKTGARKRVLCSCVEYIEFVVKRVFSSAHKEHVAYVCDIWAETYESHYSTNYEGLALNDRICNAQFVMVKV